MPVAGTSIFCMELRACDSRCCKGVEQSGPAVTSPQNCTYVLFRFWTTKVLEDSSVGVQMSQMWFKIYMLTITIHSTRDGRLVTL